jgi:hypothetical protein
MSLFRQAEAWVALFVVVISQGCSRGPTREQAEKSRANMAKICKAIHEYEYGQQDGVAPRGKLPTRVLMTKDGKPGLSWRVAILPNLGEEKLYADFHLDEPWDSGHNRPLVEKMPAVYQSPMKKDEPGLTHYLSVVGPKAVLDDHSPITERRITDGTAKTIVFVEANDAVEWTKPADYDPPKDNPAAGLGKLHPEDYFLAGFASGDVNFVPATLEPASLASMFTRNGSEPFSWLEYKRKQSGEAEPKNPNGFK